MSVLTAHEGLGERTREMVSLTDRKLIQKVYAFADELDDPLSDEFYFLVSEVFERFAPQLEWWDISRRHTRDHDLGNRADEIEASLEGMKERFAARLEFASFRANDA